MEWTPDADIFETGAECVVNPVNCQAHHLKTGRQMGLAGAFEARYPATQPPFRKACAEGKLKPGGVQMIRIDSTTGERSGTGDRVVANVATKDHWRDPSRLEWVDEGLRKLAGAVETRGIGSVAIPMLGAGYGKLPWEKVRSCVESHFGPLAAKGVAVTVLGEGPEREDRKADAEVPPEPVANAVDPALAVRDFYAGIGARDTPAPVLARMEKVGRLMAVRGVCLRSGGAPGADSAFERGTDAAGASGKEIFLPWEGFDPGRDGNRRFSNGVTVFCDEPSPEHLDLARKYHPGFDGLGRGPQKLIARNACQVLGRNLDQPSKVLVCWTREGEVRGGTGQALRIAEENGIGVVNMGDARLRRMSAESIANIATAIVEGRKLEPALTAERARTRSAEAQR